MGLQLGLESLNNTPATVIPFSIESLIDMGEQALAVESLMNALDSYYSAAVNAMTIRKSIKRFGKTQSTAFLVGQEGLAAAQSFSMEGFWGNVKNFLVKIWEKIKEWWGRFWGMFFSVESKFSTFVSDLESKRDKSLAHDVEFDAPDHRLALGLSAAAMATSALLESIANNIDDRNAAARISTFCNHDLAGMFSRVTGVEVPAGIRSLVGGVGLDASEHGGTVSANVSATMHYKMTSVQAVHGIAAPLLAQLKRMKELKKRTEDYSKKILDKVKNMKVNHAASAGDAFGKGARAAETNVDATSEEKDFATKSVKKAAALNNRLISRVTKDITSIAVKMMAHTKINS